MWEAPPHFCFMEIPWRIWCNFSRTESKPKTWMERRVKFWKAGWSVFLKKILMLRWDPTPGIWTNLGRRKRDGGICWFPGGWNDLGYWHVFFFWTRNMAVGCMFPWRDGWFATKFATKLPKWLGNPLGEVPDTILRCDCCLCWLVPAIHWQKPCQRLQRSCRHWRLGWLRWYGCWGHFLQSFCHAGCRLPSPFGRI